MKYIKRAAEKSSVNTGILFLIHKSKKFGTERNMTLSAVTFCGGYQ